MPVPQIRKEIGEVTELIQGPEVFLIAEVEKQEKTSLALSQGC